MVLLLHIHCWMIAPPRLLYGSSFEALQSHCQPFELVVWEGQKLSEDKNLAFSSECWLNITYNS